MITSTDSSPMPIVMERSSPWAWAILTISKYDYHQTSAEYVLNNRSLWGDPYNCFQVMQDDKGG
jgi:hypothetical protein